MGNLFVETNQPHGTQVQWLGDPKTSPGAVDVILQANYPFGPGVLLSQ